jgi:ATPase subunit of ABC transporter with duplicated ATPase domains
VHIGDQTVLQYILSGLPDFSRLYQIIHKFPEIAEPSLTQIEKYTDALQKFADKNYHFVEDQVVEELKNFQMSGYENREFRTLSGGEKRLSEVVKIMHSAADLAIIDEPTNFMDYVAKAKFIDWMKGAPEAILVITHDRDVLSEVSRIIEIKDGRAEIFRGNYDDYLRQNTSRTATDMNEYETVQRQIANLQKQVNYAKRNKAKWTGTADKKNPFVVMETRAKKQIAELEQTAKPSFWIDKSHADELDFKDAARYEKYRAKNVRIGLKSTDNKSRKLLLSAENLSLGYTTPLFENINFKLRANERLEIRGRNGAGKSTLVKKLLDQQAADIRVFAGEIWRDEHARIGVYKQEMARELFDLPLAEAIEQIYLSQGLDISEQKIHQLANDYLFEEIDLATPVEQLSGGQKARLQIIAMLAGQPELLVLDEPTSHLDLPSIEELESALQKFDGAILYISHDGYFREHVGGEILPIGPTE